MEFWVKTTPPILITGIARSGTSLIAGVIELCGAFGGKVATTNKQCQNGMLENISIRNNVVIPYLLSIGADICGQYPLPDIKRLASFNDLQKRVTDVIIKEGYSSGNWFYKGDKTCLVWPIWKEAFPDAKWVIVRRSTDDIVSSCFLTWFMSAFSNRNNQLAVGATNEEEGWRWWIAQHEKRFEEMEKAGLNIYTIWPEKMVNGDYSELIKLIEWLGMEWNQDSLSFIDPKLWKSRQRLNG